MEASYSLWITTRVEVYVPYHIPAPHFRKTPKLPRATSWLATKPSCSPKVMVSVGLAHVPLALPLTFTALCPPPSLFFLLLVPIAPPCPNIIFLFNADNTETIFLCYVEDEHVKESNQTPSQRVAGHPAQKVCNITRAMSVWLCFCACEHIL